MPIDPRIALGVQAPQIESPMNVMAKAMELQGMQRQNALYERQQAELMRKQQQEAAINAAYSNARTPEGRLDEGKLLNYLAEAGAGSAIPGALETVAKSREAVSKANAAEFELARNNRSFYNKAMAALARRKNLTKADVISAGQMLADAGYVSRDIVDRGAASLPDDPEELRARLNEGIASELTPEQFLTVFAPKPATRDTGGAILTVDDNPNSPTFGQTIRKDTKTMTPGERARLLEDQRQFGITDAREAQKFELDKRKLETELELKKGELERATPEFIARVERMKAAAKYEGEQLAKARADLPGAIAKAERAITLIDEMVGKVDDKGRPVTPPHEGFRGAVGAGIGTRFIPGTAASSFQARHDQVTGAAFLEAYETLKGTGQITEIEGAKATAAITRMQLAVSEKEYIEAAREFQAAIRSGVRTSKARAGVSAPVAGGTSRVTSSGTSYTVEE